MLLIASIFAKVGLGLAFIVFAGVILIVTGAFDHPSITVDGEDPEPPVGPREA